MTSVISHISTDTTALGVPEIPSAPVSDNTHLNTASQSRDTTHNTVNPSSDTVPQTEDTTQAELLIETNIHDPSHSTTASPARPEGVLSNIPSSPTTIDAPHRPIVDSAIAAITEAKTRAHSFHPTMVNSIQNPISLSDGESEDEFDSFLPDVEIMVTSGDAAEPEDRLLMMLEDYREEVEQRRKSEPAKETESPVETTSLPTGHKRKPSTAEPSPRATKRASQLPSTEKPSLAETKDAIPKERAGSVVESAFSALKRLAKSDKETEQKEDEKHAEVLEKQDEPEQEPESEEEEQDPDVYEVEGILDSKKAGRGFQYLVKWKGFPESESTWEPTRNLTHVSELIEAFNKSRESGSFTQKSGAKSAKETVTHKPVSKSSRPLPSRAKAPVDDFSEAESAESSVSRVTNTKKAYEERNWSIRSSLGVVEIKPQPIPKGKRVAKAPTKKDSNSPAKSRAPKSAASKTYSRKGMPSLLKGRASISDKPKSTISDPYEFDEEEDEPVAKTAVQRAPPMDQVRRTSSVIRQPSPEPESEEEEEEFEIEKLLDYRGSGKNRQYLVKWKGYSLSDCTWEPYAHVAQCTEAIKELEQKAPKKRPGRPKVQ